MYLSSPVAQALRQTWLQRVMGVFCPRLLQKRVGVLGAKELMELFIRVLISGTSILLMMTSQHRLSSRLKHHPGTWPFKGTFFGDYTMTSYSLFLPALFSGVWHSYRQFMDLGKCWQPSPYFCRFVTSCCCFPMKNTSRHSRLLPFHGLLCFQPGYIYLEVSWLAQALLLLHHRQYDFALREQILLKQPSLL